MEREIQWLVRKEDGLEDMVKNLIEVMIKRKVDVFTFFNFYDEEGYMIEAYDNYDWFEVTSATRRFGEE